MKTRAAVLHELNKPAPFADSKPLRIEEIELDSPGAGEVLVTDAVRDAAVGVYAFEPIATVPPGANAAFRMVR